jgi:hypothetical protein
MKRLSVLFLTFTFSVFLFSCKKANENLAIQKEETPSKPIPHLAKQGTATQLIVEGKPFLLIAGELHNSTAGGFDYMRPVWKKMAGKNLNSLIATVSWELMEPEEGKYDFSLVDSVIAGAREANLKLVLIWFASWKNGGSIYIPSWVKKNYEKYPRVKDENGKSLEILSTFSEASRDADARAFSSLMRHIKDIDSQKQTVVMVQVENEVGVLDNLGETPGNARRDFSTAANEAYRSSVPQELIDYLVKNKRTLFPELFKVWGENGFKTSGSWEEVFGKSKYKPDKKDWLFYSYYTEELFMAWNYARYIEKITAAGKVEYPLPMYVNAWLKQPFTFIPGRYPSGGPLPQVMDIWRAAAPSIDFIAPDIYMDEFAWACKEYVRNGNPLFIPETRSGSYAAARVFYALGEHDAGCFAPFGIDNPRNAENDPLDGSYAVLKKMAPFILKNQGKGLMRGILVDTISPVQRIEMGNYIIEARMAGNIEITGALIIQTGTDEFIIAGKALDIFFTHKDKSIRIGVEAADEGTFENGEWLTKRRLNGDEVHASTWSGTGPKFPDEIACVQKISFYQYK